MKRQHTLWGHSALQTSVPGRAADTRDGLQSLCDAQDVLKQANLGNCCRELRLWGPRIHPGHFPRSVQTVRLDCWAYEGADVRALVHLPSLRTLTLHFLPVSPSPSRCWGRPE